ncbi:hypothetical protein HDU86_006537 [Geranomyces michiganensis]|nr:hypothetical protein HDU86_006537 [Geranomyces michiganensis]
MRRDQRSKPTGRPGKPSHLLDLQHWRYAQHDRREEKELQGRGKKAQDAVAHYPWQCADCKVCMVCDKSDEEAQTVICDDCDRACHTFCASPRLIDIPAGPWKCGICEGKRTRGKKLTSTPKPPSCPFPECTGAGNTLGKGSTHSSLDECPMQAKSTPRKLKRAAAPMTRNSLLSGDVATPVREPPEGPKSSRKRARTSDAETPISAQKGTPRVKLILSNKKAKSSSRKPDPPEQVMLPFGGRLTKEDANISTCKPTATDRTKFKKARLQAESLTVESSPALPSEISESGIPANGTSRNGGGDEGYYAPSEPKINSIYFGTREINTWYSAPYPEEYNGQSHIYICEYCFKYMKSQYLAGRHKAKCPLRHPPGDEIYRDGNISVFEVDGRKNKIYCQNLCLLAKMFLDHKTLYYDVEPFLFYILTENDTEGCHFVGYFSKEKRSSANYNLSCIVTMPVSQRKGYGGLLIEFSYLLSRKEGRTGSPEKPLSDLGLVSYRRYWRRTVLRALTEVKDEEVSIDELSSKTCMTPDDVVHTLHLLSMLVKNARGDYVIRCPRALVAAYLAAVDAKKGMTTIKPDLLRWTPLLFKTPIIATAPAVVVEDAADEADADAAPPEDDGSPEVFEKGQEGQDEDKNEDNGVTVVSADSDGHTAEVLQ